MGFVKLIGWCVATGVLAYVGFVISAFSGSGAVPPPERAALWKALSFMFAPIYAFFIPTTIAVALVVHFTRFAWCAHWALLAGALAAIAYPCLLMMTVTR